jgi:hypothetical protein
MHFCITSLRCVGIRLTEVPDVRADEDFPPSVLILARAVLVGLDAPREPVALPEKDAFVVQAVPGVQPDGFGGPGFRVPVVPAAHGALAVLAVRDALRGVLGGVLGARVVRVVLIGPAALVVRRVAAVPDGPAALDVLGARVSQPADWPVVLADAAGPPEQPAAAVRQPGAYS